MRRGGGARGVCVEGRARTHAKWSKDMCKAAQANDDSLEAHGIVAVGVQAEAEIQALLREGVGDVQNGRQASS